MRFKITFNRTGKHRMIPMDYQYYISAWIYKVLSKADREFAAFLHKVGYKDGLKRFKHFNYSPLDFGRPVMWKEKGLFEIKTDNISMRVSFSLNDAAQKFIIGLFKDQEAYLGDKFNGIDLTVTQVESLPEPEMDTTMHYRAVSPVVISIKDDTQKYAQYLSPEDFRYSDLLRQHFINKHSTIPGADSLMKEFELDFSTNGNIRSKLVTIKPYTPQHSKVRGYVYNFELTAPVAIHRLLLSSGAGEKNSMGFGWCEVGSE